MYGNYLYGAVSYGDNLAKEIDTTPFTTDLMKYLPPVYQEVLEIKEIQHAIEPELGQIKFNVASTVEQVFIEFASWGLSRWESELGIVTDFSKPEHFRREIIKARLRARGTVTKQLIINMAKAFSGGEVDVIEYPKEFRFVVKFIGILGIPPNLAGLIAEIDNIKPAHLLYEFEYTYTTWNSLKAITWNEASLNTWDAIRSFRKDD